MMMSGLGNSSTLAGGCVNLSNIHQTSTLRSYDYWCTVSAIQISGLASISVRIRGLL